MLDKYYIELAKLNTSLYRRLFKQVKYLIDFSISVNLWSNVFQYDGKRYRKLIRLLTKVLKHIVKTLGDPNCKGLPMNKKSVDLIKEFNSIFKIADKHQEKNHKHREMHHNKDDDSQDDSHTECEREERIPETKKPRSRQLKQHINEWDSVSSEPVKYKKTEGEVVSDEVSETDLFN